MSLVATGIVDARPRARRAAWWAVLTSCALHAMVAGLWWRERIEPAGMRAAHAPEAPFFVDLLAAKAPPALPEQKLEDLPASGSGPAQPGRADTPPAPAVTPRQRSGAHRAPAPSTAQDRTPAPSSGVPAPARDFGWRPEDAQATGMRQARGTPVVRLGPKAPVEQSEIARGIAKSARPPCKNAHADMGLLALPFLLADTVTDRGCKW
ncbi:hypothetical protein FOC84_23230 [Achromobacter pestifer]|uniref:Uncharacterized protein n=1 Tax=Achromobacter pestifer TaxID=1353889 RepID=A0A7D4IAN1_9BURK|nr:hypothetical protein [Achromobacter pestifer]QKH37681.1 hypothetical protein FOC84_23230 [Achromobacter pestifer]